MPVSSSDLVALGACIAIGPPPSLRQAAEAIRDVNRQLEAAEKSRRERLQVRRIHVTHLAHLNNHSSAT